MSRVDRTLFIAPSGADAPRERPRVDALYAQNAVAFQVVAKGFVRTPVAGQFTVFPDHETLHLGPPRLDVDRIDAVVADERVGHRDNLAPVGWVGEDFLVSGDAGIEDDLALAFTGRAEGFSLVAGAVFQGKYGFHGRV